MKKIFVVGITFFLAAVCQGAVEFFVGPQGNDDNDGLSREGAFLTVQKGVDALDEGDVLTILPGEYFENVRRTDMGGPDRDTVIRAEIPGTVMLRGDVPAPEFSRVKGCRFVHAADFEQVPQAVNETDTLTIFEKSTGIRELEFSPGSFFFDESAKKLYISTSDLRSPEKHRYTVSVNPNSGLMLDTPLRVVIEGLGARGFSRASRSPPMSKRGFARQYIWGVALEAPTGCVIRASSAFLNSGGICFSGGASNVIEDCEGFANYSKYAVEGGNIFRAGGHADVIRRCTASRSRQAGMRFYGSFTDRVLLEDNLAWGNEAGDFWIKGAGAQEHGLARRCIGLNTFNVRNTTACLMGGQNSYQWETGASDTDITLLYLEGLDRKLEFADPENFDFRLQADSRFSGRGPYKYEANVFYVAGDGDDGNDGLKITRPLKSAGQRLRMLRAGDTIYLRGGVWEEDLEIVGVSASEHPVFIRGYGVEQPVIRGRVVVEGSSGVVFERLRFEGEVRVKESRAVSFANCFFDGVSAESTQDFRATHCLFGAGLKLDNCKGVYLSGNLFEKPVDAKKTEVFYADYNGYPAEGTAWRLDDLEVTLEDLQGRQQDRYSHAVVRVVDAGEKPQTGGEIASPLDLSYIDRGPSGAPLGPFRKNRQVAERAEGPFLYQVGSTTADLEWWTTAPMKCEIAWGRSEDCPESATINANGFVTYSLTGLTPGEKYYYKLRSLEPVVTINTFGRPEVSQPDGGVQEFRTADMPAAARVLYVAPDGDDSNSGLSREEAWQTISQACDQARAGDTVLFAGGTYSEMAWVRTTGDEEAPITFKAAPGEKVVLDGQGRTLTSAFVVDGKKHIEFDGFYLKMFNNAVHDSPLNRCGSFLIYKSEDIRITRCFHDGRGTGYSPVILSCMESSRVTVKNCVITSGFSGMRITGSPDFRLENNVFIRNLISAFGPVNQPHEKVYVERNIFTDGLPIKVKAPVMEVGSYESLVERDNCYYLRVPSSEKKIFMFYGGESYARCARAYGWSMDFAEPPVFTDLTHLTLEEYQEMAGDTGSFAGDPLFSCTLEMSGTGRDGRKLFMPDAIMGRQELDFPDLFATDPGVAARGIGLEPDAFDDFWFKRAEAINKD